MSTTTTELAEKASADKIQKIVVGAYIVNDKGEVLVLQRSDHEFKGGLYELPSGGVEKGETWEQALRREVMEEAGLRITDIVGFVSNFDYKSESGKACRQHNFLVNVVDLSEIALSDEHKSFVWVAESASIISQFDGPMQAQLYAIFNINSRQATVIRRLDDNRPQLN